MHNSKDMLARLLANENLNIVRSNAHTASFNIVERTLVLPNWKEMSVTVEDMLISHEVGHALFTDQSYLKTENYKVIHGYLNVIEDVRIEKKMKARYPGLRKIFSEAYKELNARDFFETSSVKLNDLLLIDRINLYYKCGINCGVKFDKEEISFVQRADRCDTITDVQNLALEIYEYSYGKIKQKKENQLYAKNLSKEDLDKIIREELEQSTSDDEFDNDIDNDIDDDIDDDIAGDEYDNEDNEDDEDKNINSENQPMSSSSDNTDEPSEEELSSKTERSLRNRLQDMADVNTIVQKFTPEYYDRWTTNSFVECKELINEIELEINSMLERSVGTREHEYAKEFKTYGCAEGVKFRTNANKIVNYLVKEFEMRKSADAYKRTTLSKSGSLNSSKLAMYKLTEDMFKRISITKDAKNHGMIMLVDWSGSMFNVIDDTLKQTITLAMFCKRAQIPFSVYAFTNAYYNLQSQCDDNKVPPPQFTGFSGPETYMLELFNDKMTSSEMNKMIDYCIAGFYKMSKRLALGSTPLNEALLMMCSKVGEFKTKNNVEKVSFITLTDGDGASLRGNHEVTLRDAIVFYEPEYKKCKVVNILYDPMTRKEYTINTVASMQTKTLLQIIKDRWNATTVGFYILNNSRRNYVEFVRNNINLSSHDSIGNIVDELQLKVRREGFAYLTNCGRDEMYLISASKLQIVDGSLEISDNMSSRQISKNFTKHLNGKKTNRVLLNRFVNLIA